MEGEVAMAVKKLLEWGGKRQQKKQECLEVKCREKKLKNASKISTVRRDFRPDTQKQIY